MRIVTHIVLHTAASASKSGRAVHASVDDIRRYHVEEKGWDDIGYHYYLGQDGHVYLGRPVEKAGAHVSGYFNRHSIGACVSGHGDLESWNEPQVEGVVQLCADLCRRFKLNPAKAILGHRDCDERPEHDRGPIYKTCPGLKVTDQVLDDIRVRVLKELQKPDTEEELSESLGKAWSELTRIRDEMRDLKARCDTLERKVRS